MKSILTHLKKFLPLAQRYLVPIAVALVLAITAYGVYSLTRLEPGNGALETGRQELRQKQIRFDEQTLSDLKQRVSIPSAVKLDNVGKSDPFSP